MNELQPYSYAPQAPRPAAEPSTTAHDLALILWRRLWLILLIVAVSTLTAALLSKRTQPMWRANAQVLLVQRSPIMAPTPQAAASAPMIESIDTQITLLQSRELAEEAGRKVNVPGEIIQGATAITPRKDGDNVIDVSVEADSRQRAVDWATALCNTFVEYKTRLAQNNSQQDLSQLQVQANQAAKQVAEADQKLLDFQNSHHLNGLKVLDPQAQQSAALNSVITQNSLIASLNNDNIAAQADALNKRRQLQQGKAVIASSGTVRDDNEVEKLQENLHDLQHQRSVAGQKYLPVPGSPGGLILQQLDAQIAQTQANLRQAIQASESQPSLEAQAALTAASQTADAAAQTAQIKLDEAIKQGRQLQQQTQDLPRISLEAQSLINSDKQAHDLYNAASAGVNGAQLDQATANGNVQIVQPAFAPEAPFRPSPGKDMMVGFGIGLVLSLLAVLLLEQMDGSVRTASDVRRLVDGPVVAVLPQMSRTEKAQFAQGERPPHLIETYNAARANLGLAMRQRTGVNLDDHQVILVTSALPGEGKSLTASELAHSYARAGRRVVLVNADMRRPSALLQKNKMSQPGLAEVLAGDLRVADALLPTETANLSMLHGGNAVQNPIDLISHERLAGTIQALREAADVIIVDSPPAAVVADALLIAPYVDCVLYVVGVGIVDSENMRNTSGALAAASPKMLAYFVNRVPHFIGEPANYSYAAYGRTTFVQPPPNPDGTPRTYKANRTILMERYEDPDDPGQVIVTDPRPESSTGNGVAAGNGVSPANSVTTDNGTRSSLRILPRVGTSLVTLEGPYTGQNFVLSPKKSLTLGARADSDIVLARDETVSQVHAHIAPEDKSFVVYDVSSTNGTFVNDVLVTRHTLEVGDILKLGSSRFRYE